MANVLNGIEYRTQNKNLQNAVKLSNDICYTSKTQVGRYTDLVIAGSSQIVYNSSITEKNAVTSDITPQNSGFLRHTNALSTLLGNENAGVVYVKIKKLSELIAENFPNENIENLTHYPTIIDYEYNTKNTNSYTYSKTKLDVNGVTVGSAWNGKYVVTDIVFYVGTAENENRVIEEKNYIAIPFTAGGTESIRYDNLDPVIDDRDVVGAIFVNPLIIMDDGEAINYNQMLPSNIVAGITAPFYDLLQQTAGYNISGLTGGFLSFTTAAEFVNTTAAFYSIPVFDDVQSITDFFNSLGVPWTYSETAAESIPVDNPDFNPDFLTSGQPENPTGGGNGSGDNSSDRVIPQGVVQIPASGIVNIWNIPLVEAIKLDSVLWNIDLVAQADKGLYTDIINAIVSLKFYPFTTTTSAETLVSVADTDLLYTDEGGNTYRVNGTQGAPREWCDFYIGEFFIEEYYGTSFDYAPYTKIDLFLPFIGYKKLDTNEVMNTLLKVRYQIDFLSGGVTALIYAGDKIVDTANGTIGIEIPLVSSNRATTETMYSLIKAANTMSTVSSIGALASGAATKNPVAAAGGAISLGQSLAGAARSQIAAGEYSVTKAGAVGDASSYYGVLEPYLIIERPITAYPKNLASLEGYPSNFGGKVSDFSGFLKCATTQLDGITATSTEIDEIDRFLKSGIFV